MHEPLARFFQHRGLVVAHEVPTREGWIDVVGAGVDWAAARRRKRLGMLAALSSPTLVLAYEKLPADAPSDLETWAGYASVSVGAMRSIARRLERDGFVSATPLGFVRRASIPKTIAYIACCEAKLSDWRGALRQAYAHRFYADACWIALPIGRVVDVGRLDQFGIGVLDVEEVRVRERVQASLRNVFALHARRLIEERIWETAVLPALNTRPRKASSRPTEAHLARASA